MTYLQLCQRLRAECQDIGNGPTTTVAPTGKDVKYVDAIAEAWTEIQLLRGDWEFWPADLSYTLESPQLLDGDADVPFIPSQYHLGIVYYAMGMLALNLGAPELQEKHQAGWSRYYDMLLARYTGAVIIGEPVIQDSGDDLLSIGEVLAQ